MMSSGVHTYLTCPYRKAAAEAHCRRCRNAKVETPECDVRDQGVSVASKVNILPRGGYVRG